jgi:hypothetical protein
MAPDLGWQFTATLRTGMVAWPGMILRKLGVPVGRGC